MSRLFSNFPRRAFSRVLGVTAVLVLAVASSASAANPAPAKLVLNYTSHNYAGVTPPGSVPFDFTLKNTGGSTSGPVVVTVSGADAGQFSAGSCTGPDVNGNGSLDAGKSCTIHTAFAPGSTAYGNKKATLNAGAAAGTPGGTAHAALSGTALNAHLTVTPPSPNNFGEQLVDTQTPTPLDFTVTNDGTAPTDDGTTLTGVPLNFGFAGADVTQFKYLQDPNDSGDCQLDGPNYPTVLSPLGGSCQIHVVFAPDSTGNKHSSLAVSANPGGLVYSALYGTGIQQKLSITSPTNGNFGSKHVGETGNTVTFTVKNIGTAPTSTDPPQLAIGSNNPEFAIVPHGIEPVFCDTSSGTVLDVGESCAVEVTFTPSGAGNRTGKLTVGDGVVSSQANMTGKGLLAKLDLTPKTWSFGTVTNPATISKVFVVKNSGTYVNDLGGHIARTSGSSDFSVMPDPAATGCGADQQLQPGQSCTVLIQFAPGPGAGFEGATFVVVTNTALETGSGASVTGTGA